MYVAIKKIHVTFLYIEREYFAVNHCDIILFSIRSGFQAIYKVRTLYNWSVRWFKYTRSLLVDLHFPAQIGSW